MKVYISGPITGTDDYMERFADARWRSTIIRELSESGALSEEWSRVGACK